MMERVDCKAPKGTNLILSQVEILKGSELTVNNWTFAESDNSCTTLQLLGHTNTQIPRVSFLSLV